MNANDYTTEKGYFRNDPKCGRTTKLVEKKTKNVVFEGLGVWTRAQLIYSYQYSILLPHYRYATVN